MPARKVDVNGYVPQLENTVLGRLNLEGKPKNYIITHYSLITLSLIYVLVLACLCEMRQALSWVFTQSLLAWFNQFWPCSYCAEHWSMTVERQCDSLYLYCNCLINHLYSLCIPCIPIPHFQPFTASLGGVSGNESLKNDKLKWCRLYIHLIFVNASCPATLLRGKLAGP